MQRNWLAVLVVSFFAASIGSAAAQAQDTPVVPPAPVPPVAAPSASAPAPAMASNPNDVSDPMATQDPDQIICVKEKLTGSMLPSTVCQTRRNWIKQGVNSRDLIGHAQNVGSGQPRGN